MCASTSLVRASGLTTGWVSCKETTNHANDTVTSQSVAADPSICDNHPVNSEELRALSQRSDSDPLFHGSPVSKVILKFLIRGRLDGDWLGGTSKELASALIKTGELPQKVPDRPTEISADALRGRIADLRTKLEPFLLTISKDHRLVDVADPRSEDPRIGQPRHRIEIASPDQEVTCIAVGDSAKAIEYLLDALPHLRGIRDTHLRFRPVSLCTIRT